MSTAQANVKEMRSQPGHNPSQDIPELLEKHYSLVFSIALARLRDRDAAEDLAQEVFLRAFVQLDRSRNAEGRLAWLICVTRNLATDWSRRDQRVSRLIQEMSQETQSNKEHAFSIANNPREKLMQREEGSALEGALGKLPVEQRELVLLHYMGGQTRREIAAQLGLHPTTVGRQLDAALAQLKGTLEPLLRQHFTATKPGTPALMRAGAVLAAFSVIEGTARAELLAGPAWRQGEAVIARAVHTLASSSTGASTGKITGSTLITMATTTGKGAVAMGQGKLIGGIIAATVIAGTAGMLAVKNNDQPSQTAAASTAGSTVTQPTGARDPLPPLPSGWKLSVSPSKPHGQMRMSSGMGTYDYVGLNITNALNCFGADAREVDPAVAGKTETYDMKLTAPAGTNQEDAYKVLQVEMQRLFGFRATLERRKVPSLVLRCPAGTPPAFKPAAGEHSSRGGETIKLRGIGMAGFAKTMAMNRKVPVFDETGLKGEYDMDIPNGSPGNSYGWTDESIEKLGLQVMREDREANVLMVVPAG